MDPVTISIAAMTALSGIMDAFGAYANQKAQYKLQVKQAQAEALERREDYILESAELQQRMREINTQAAAETLERRLELQREAARLAVATGEAGVGGNLVERLQVNAAQTAGRDIGTIKYNRDIQIGQSVRHGFTLQRRARPPKVFAQKPNIGLAFLRSGLAIGTGAITGYKESKRTA